MTIKYLKIYGEISISSDIVKKAIKVALIVGTTLNLINQGEAMLCLDIEHINFIKFFLTYLVPYSVTTYTATTMKIEFHIGTKAIIETDLECRTCAKVIHVQKGEIIPECPTCGLKTHWKLK